MTAAVGPSSRLILLSPIVAAISIATTPAAAQQADAPVEKVEIKGRAADYDPRRDDTATRIVVQHDEIVKYGDTSVLEVLRRVPGITVSGTPGRNDAQIRMRGLGGNYTQILVNGERAPAGFSIDTLAPDVIERIEVLRAATAEYSTESIAGTINIVLRQVAKKSERELKLGYGRGPDTRSPSANLQLSDKLGRFSYSVAANAMRNNFTGEALNDEQQYSPDGLLIAARHMDSHESGSFNSFNLVPRLNWKFDGGDTLSLDSSVMANRMMIALHAPTSTELGPLAAVPERDITMSGHRASFQTGLDWTHKMAEGASLKVKVSANAQKGTDTAYRDERGNPAVGANTRKIDTDASNRGLSSTGKFTVPLWHQHTFAVGWEGRYDKRIEDRLERDYLRESAPIPGGDEDMTARIARIAVYAQDEWNVTQNWSLYLGARWQGVRLDADGNTFGTSRSSYAVLSPVMQTLYKLPGAKGRQLRLAVTRTYSAPGLQQLVSHLLSINNNQSEPDILPNPKLKPELATGVDAGYEHFWASGAMVSVSASTRLIQDYTRYLVTLENNRWVTRATNSGNIHTENLELETKFPLKALLANAPAMDVRASVARNWTRGFGNRFDRHTPLTASLGVDYGAGSWTTGGSLTFKSGSDERLSAEQTQSFNVQRNLDLYALWKLNPQYQLRLAASGVLGQDMFREATYLGPAGILRDRFGRVNYASVRATLEAKF
jgi:outer membrane receptor protein involved in Fe transport